MVGIVAGLIHISTSLIIINTFSTILKIRVAGHMRPKSMSSVVTTYITPIIIMHTFVNRT